MNKLNLFQNKVLSLSLIVILTFQSYNLLPENFNKLAGDFSSLIPIFTFFIITYVCVYGINQILAKVLLTILVLITLSFLCIYAVMLQL